MTHTLLQECARFAGSMAAKAAEIARDRFGRAATSRKPDGSHVTDADIAIQDMIVERIAAAYPDHMIIGEEGGVIGGSVADARDAEYCWVIDPLDGTRNYASGVPIFATAIAVLQRHRPVVGLVRSLTTGDVYIATRHAGATRNGRKLSVHPGPYDQHSMIAVQSTIRGNDSRIVDALSGSAVLRNLGSTALHMALVAAGGFSGVIAAECKLWDVAAGYLLVEEAGGICTDWSGQPLLPFSVEAYEGQDTPFVAAAPEAHSPLIARIAAI